MKNKLNDRFGMESKAITRKTNEKQRRKNNKRKNFIMKKISKSFLATTHKWMVDIVYWLGLQFQYLVVNVQCSVFEN